MTDYSASQRKAMASRGAAMPGKPGGSGGRFPIANANDLKNAIRAVGRARPNTPEERAKVRRYIVRRASALGLSSRIPASWKGGGPSSN